MGDFYFFTHILLSILFLVAIVSQKLTNQSSAWFSNLISGKMCLFVNYAKKIKSCKFLSECKIVQMWTVNLKEHLVKRSSLVVLLLVNVIMLCGNTFGSLILYTVNVVHEVTKYLATNWTSYMPHSQAEQQTDGGTWICHCLFCCVIWGSWKKASVTKVKVSFL